MFFFCTFQGIPSINIFIVCVIPAAEIEALRVFFGDGVDFICQCGRQVLFCPQGGSRRKSVEDKTVLLQQSLLETLGSWMGELSLLSVTNGATSLRGAPPCGANTSFCPHPPKSMERPVQGFLSTHY